LHERTWLRGGVWGGVGEPASFWENHNIRGRLGNTSQAPFGGVYPPRGVRCTIHLKRPAAVKVHLGWFSEPPPTVGEVGVYGEEPVPAWGRTSDNRGTQWTKCGHTALLLVPFPPQSDHRPRSPLLQQRGSKLGGSVVWVARITALA